ncbi:MAG: tetratricopeptide repeat protein [Pseudomonadales bacterium]
MFQRLATEIRRRKVLRVVAVYAVTAWVVLQVGVVVSEPLNFPAWTMRALIIATIVGFPIAFVLAWVIDIRPEGLIFDLPLFGGAAEREQRKSDLIMAVLLVLLLGASAYYLIILLLSETASMMEPSEQVGIESTAAPNSIAVIPFQNFSGSTEAEYFAAGLAEEIILTLSSLKELKVASRTSSFQFRDSAADVKDIAARLSVANVLSGSARQAEGRVIVASYLSKASSGYIDWVQKYERPLDDIFKIQQEIASSIVTELQLVLSPDSKAELEKQATNSSKAYVEYLEGVGRLRSSRDVDVMKEASQLFSKAISIDPRFARAHAGVCEALLRIFEKSNSKIDFELAENACIEAERLDTSLGDDIALALGKLYLFQGRYELAEAQLSRALQLSDQPADVYIEIGELKNRQGHFEEAEQALKKASQNSPDYWATEEALGSLYYTNKRYKEAIKHYKRASQLAPSVATVYSGMGISYWMLGDFDHAIDAYQQSLKVKPTRQAYTNIGLLQYYKKNFDSAIEYQQNALELAPDDHRVWGRLGEAYYFAKRPEDARETFAQAAKLAESNLQINVQDIKTIRLAAVYYAHMEQGKKATTMAQRAIELTPEHPESHYAAAQVHMLLGEDDQAISALATALSFNERYAVMIGRSPYFAELRAQTRLKDMLLPYQDG